MSTQYCQDFGAQQFPDEHYLHPHAPERAPDHRPPEWLDLQLRSPVPKDRFWPIPAHAVQVTAGKLRRAEVDQNPKADVGRPG